MKGISNQGVKLPNASKFSLPKLPQGRPMSGAGASRSSSSAYGKVSKGSGGNTSVPMEKQ